MIITMVATVMIMVAYFLVLYGGVGFIQDKKFFLIKKRDFEALM